MSKLQIQYSKEFARELGKIAVYLPGEHVEVGDIITFPNGNSFLGNSRPLGTFKKATSLKKMGVKYDEPKFSGNVDTYRFSSKNSIDFDLKTEAKATLGSDAIPSLDSNIKLQFSSEGSIYFLAIDCDKKELNDFASLENEINANGKKLIWEDTYLVTSVTIANRAFMVQSKSKSSQLVMSGDFKGIKSGTTDINASTKLEVKKQEGDVL